jgi:hypothetical protein
MDRRLQRDQQLEGTAKPTEKAKKAGPPPWELKQYIYQESSTDDGRSSHSDPRLELAQQSHGQHQDSGVIPSDADHGYGYPAFGSGFTPHLDASTSSASEWGTLAGGQGYSKPRSPERRNMNQVWRDIQGQKLFDTIARHEKNRSRGR